MAMKSMKHLFRKSKKDKKIGDTSHSHNGDDENAENGVSAEESTEFSKSESQHSVNIAEDISINRSIHDDGTVQSDMKSQATNQSAIQRRPGPRKSRRALREESKRTLATEFATSNHTANRSLGSTDDDSTDDEDGLGIFIDIPVSINAQEPKNLKSRSRSRSRDGRRSQGRAASRSCDRGALSSRKLSTNRSRSSDRRRNRLGSANSDEISTDNTTPLSNSADKGFLSQLQDATKEGSPDAGNTPAAGKETFVEANTEISNSEEQSSQGSPKSDYPEEVTKERRARRSERSDGRQRAQSGSKDRSMEGSETKEKRRSTRSVSRDGRQRSSTRNRSHRSKSRDVNASSKRGKNSDRLGSSSHHTTSRNRSKSTDRRGVRRSKSIISSDSNEGIQLLFCEGKPIARRPSVDDTVVASNIQQLVEGPAPHNPPEKLDTPPHGKEQEVSTSTVLKEIVSPLKQQGESNATKRSPSCDSRDSESRGSTSSRKDYRATGRSMSRVRRSRHRSSRSRSAEKSDKGLAATPKTRRKDEIASSEDKEGSQKTSSTKGGSNEKAIVSAPENEKQVQKVSVVFIDESFSQKESSKNDQTGEKVSPKSENETTPASTLLGILGEDPSLSKALSRSPTENEVKLEAIKSEKERTDESPTSSEENENILEGPAELPEKEKRMAARKARREKKMKEAQTAPVAESNLTTLLGMIGSSADDFKSKTISNAEELFENPPMCSVDFFQSIAGQAAENGSDHKLQGGPEEKVRGVFRSISSDDATLLGRSDKSNERTRGVVRSNSSDDAKELVGLSTAGKPRKRRNKGTSMRNILSQSDHVSDTRAGRKATEDQNTLPLPLLAGNLGSKPTKSIERKTTETKVTSAVIDAFALLGGSDTVKLDDCADSVITSTTNESKSRKIRLVKDSCDDGLCEQSLAPPSLAGDAMPSSVRNKKMVGLQTVSECAIDESGDQTKPPIISRKMSKRAKSFAVLQCDENDDSFLDGFLKEKCQAIEESKTKKRGSLMKSMKKATSAMDVVGKGSKGVASKAKSAKNVLDKATTKVFSRRKAEGKELL